MADREGDIIAALLIVGCLVGIVVWPPVVLLPLPFIAWGVIRDRRAHREDVRRWVEASGGDEARHRWAREIDERAAQRRAPAPRPDHLPRRPGGSS